MSEKLTTNSAERASNFIKSYVEISRIIERDSANAKIRSVLAAMHEIEQVDTSGLMNVLSDAWKLPVQVRSDIRKAGLEVGPFEHVMRQLETMLNSMALDAVSRSIRLNIPEGLLPNLGIISTVLSKDVPESLISEDRIKEILGQLTNIEDEIRGSDFDSVFTDYVLHNTARIRYALDHYGTLGPDETLARVDQMFGGFIRQHSKLANTRKKSEIISKLLKAGGAIIIAVNALNGAFELDQNITALIQSGEVVDAEVVTEAAPVRNKS